MHVGLRQEGAVVTDQTNCAALAALEEQTAQLADTSQQLAVAIVAARDAARTKLADLQTVANDLQVVTRFASCALLLPELLLAPMLWLLQAALLTVTTQLGAKKAEQAGEAGCSGPCIDSSALLAFEHSIAGKEEEVCC